jgi:potassium-transporting ATPase KdpC subunit
MKTHAIIALKILIVMTVITGIVYPLLTTAFAQILFYHKANGSLIEKNGKVIGSELIGQKFDSTIYFWSRPSAIDYNSLPSGGSNLGPTSSKLKSLMTERRNNFALANGIDCISVPIEMYTASASGIDPDISPNAALLQVDRIVKARKFSRLQKQKLVHLIHIYSENYQFSLLGEPRVNVLLLNLSLDSIQ